MNIPKSLIVRIVFFIWLAFALSACNIGMPRTSSSPEFTATSQSVASKAPLSSPTFYMTLTPTITKSPEPIALPTLYPLTIDRSLDIDEFHRPNAILFSESPGVAQWYDLSIINEDGTERECITCETSKVLDIATNYYAKFLSPAWSSDGIEYAFVTLSIPWDGILVKKENEPDVVIMSGDNAWFDNLAWSVDGKFLAYDRTTKEHGADVCYIQVEDENSEKCIRVQNININPGWSPDGKRILFVATRHFYIWNLEDDSISQFTDIEGERLLGKWSPDGSKFAYVLGIKTESSTQTNLYMANADGTGGEIVPNTEGIDDFGWSPDGTKIVFTQLSPIKNENCDVGCLPFTVLKIIDLETGEISSLTDGTQWIGDPSWRP
jgi:hypothetical protein